MDLINRIVEIIVAHKVIITWIVVGWLLLVYLLVKPLHKKPIWRDLIRGTGEVFLGGMWALLCAGLFHFIPGLSIMLFVVFGMFHRIRQFKDKFRDDKEDPRTRVGPIYAFIYVAAIIVLNWWMQWSLTHDFRRGIAQLTSNTLFGDATDDYGHSMHGTGIRPSELQTAAADSTAFWTKILSAPKSPKQSKKQSTTQTK